MRILLDRQADQPVYAQISTRLQHLITTGSLAPGDRLPSIRELARSLQVNKLTVIEAYDRLAAEGLITSRQGSGYFVETPCPPHPSSPLAFAPTFAPKQDVVLCEPQRSAFFQVYARTLQARHQPEFIDFSCGYPRYLPPDIARVTRRVAGMSEMLFNYDYVQGQGRLRQQIATVLLQIGLELSADELIITNGSMQGLSLVLQHTIQPGDWVIVESPTYHGLLAILEQMGARIIGIPMTATGMNLTLLAQYLHSHRPKLIYTMSTLQNPTGISTSLAHRQELLSLARQYHCPILEDNAYEGLNGDPVPPPIKSLDHEGLVTYLGTFSKTLLPGLRVGYLAPPREVYPLLLERKLLSDMHTPTVSQTIVSEYLACGNYRRHLHRLRTAIWQNRNCMLQAMETHFPTGVSWTVPTGGMFLWVQLPLPFADRVQEIAQRALDAKVVFTEGSNFFPARQGYPAMRLAFANSTPDEIEQGIALLGRLLKAFG